MRKIKKDKLILTNSAVKTFKTCSMKYNWRYVRGIVPIEDKEALKVGTAVHGYLESFYKRIPYYKTSVSGLSAKSKGFIDGVADSYPFQYGNDFERFEVIEVEKNLYGPIKNPVSGRSSRACAFGGKLDLLVRTKAKIENIPIGSLILIESKTTSRADDKFWEKLKMDYQTLLYANYIKQEKKEKVFGVLFNVIEKPAIRQRKSESDSEFEDRVRLAMSDGSHYYRKFIRLTSHSMRSALKDLWKSQQQITRVRLLGNYTKNPTACFNYFTKCEYYQLCNSERPEQVIKHSGLYKSKKVNSELDADVHIQFPVDKENDIAPAVSF